MSAPYDNTNNALRQLEQAIFNDTDSVILNTMIEKLFKAINQERESTHTEIENLRQECNIKSFYINELEKSKTTTSRSKDTLIINGIEGDLIDLVNRSSNVLSRVSHLRSRH
jgi:hypothetical protein